MRKEAWSWMNSRKEVEYIVLLVSGGHYYFCGAENFYKNLFLRKNLADHVGFWFGQSGKGRKNPRNCWYQKVTFSFCRELLFRPSVRIRVPNWWHENLSNQKKFLHLLLERSFPRNESKIRCMLTIEILPSLTTERKFNRESYWKEF